MIQGKKVLALIPARGGSKGIKNKNIISIAGKPLISYTIEAACLSEYIDKVIVSTDSEKIKEVSQAAGAEVPFIRPQELARDTSKTIDVVCHALDFMAKDGNNFDILVLLQPTSPLRDYMDIDGAIEKYLESGEQSVVGVSKVRESPILMRTIDEFGKMKKLLNMQSTVRRQDMPAFYIVNGSIYVNCVREINSETSFNDNLEAYVMSEEHSVDIDDYKDLLLAERYLIGK